VQSVIPEKEVGGRVEVLAVELHAHVRKGLELARGSYPGGGLQEKVVDRLLKKRPKVACKPGTDVMIFLIFSPKNLAKILAFFAQTTASFCKNCDHNIGF
jgi:hypothetical protein